MRVTMGSMLPQRGFAIPGYGLADPALMKRVRRYAARAEKRGPRETLGSIIYRPRALMRALLPAPTHVRNAKAYSGKSGLQQRWERAALVAFLRMDPDAYYLFGLHNRERYARAGEFVCSRQLWNLHSYLARSTDPASRDVIGDKTRFFHFCAEHDIPTPEIIATCSPTSARFEAVVPPEGLFHQHREIFFKPQKGSCGKGTGVLTSEPSGSWTLVSGTERREALSWLEVSEHFEQVAVPMVFQPRVHNHALLSRFGKHALHTLRVLTIRQKGEVVPRAVFLKIADPKAIADNFALGSIAVDVDVISGRLGFGVRNDRTPPPARISHLPETGERFTGLKLPFWTEAITLARRLHRRLDALPSIAQDIALTDAGPVLIEATESWGGDGLQKLADTGLGQSVLPALFSEHFGPS